ncbi:MAG: hypothetical protein GY755_12440 [Chloroflexi bacterium]|nr:hypothetical protein [Chloroflexota bacterium]
MDQATISIISTVLGVVSLFVVITGYNIPETRRNFFGKNNLFAEKANIIENTMTAIFSSVAGLSFFCLVINDIYGEIIPERLHSIGYYWLVFLGAGVIALFVTALLTFLGDKIARKKWLVIGVEGYGKEGSVYTALQKIELGKNSKRAKEFLETLEKYFELSPEKDVSLQERFDTIKPFFEI